MHLGLLIPELFINNNYIAELKSDTLVKELKDYLKKTNFIKSLDNDKTFKIVTSDNYNNIKNVNKSDVNTIRLIVLVIFIFLYVFISIIISTFRQNP